MIYFIEYAGLIKVGYAADVEKRLKDFRTVMPSLELIGTMEGSRGHERTIHDCLSVHRHKREWFKGCSEVRAFIHLAISEGVGEWKPSRSSKFSPSMWDMRAKRLCEIIIAERPKSDIRAIERELDIPAGTLWNVRYRQSKEVSVGQYFALVTAARETIKRRLAELNSAAAFVGDLEREDADNTNKTINAEKQFATFHAAKALAGENSET